jgi:hypothetical protein
MYIHKGKTNTKQNENSDNMGVRLGTLGIVRVHPRVSVTRSLVLCVCFVDRCLSFCTFSFGYCVVCSSSIYGLWLPLWYLQTRLTYSYVY